jgi:hypothetical protein
MQAGLEIIHLLMYNSLEGTISTKYKYPVKKGRERERSMHEEASTIHAQ